MAALDGAPRVSEEIRQINAQFLNSLYGPKPAEEPSSHQKRPLLVVLGVAIVMLFVVFFFAFFDYVAPFEGSSTEQQKPNRRERRLESDGDNDVARAPLPLLCHITSPSLMAHTNASSALPEPGICDYIVLETHLREGGGYSPEDYEFLSGYNGQRKVLLTFPRLEWRAMKATALSQHFIDSARGLYHILNVRGFGILSFHYETPTGLDEEIADILDFYQVLNNSLWEAGFRGNTANFFSIQPRHLSRGTDAFKALLTGLQRRVQFIILETFFRTLKGCTVQPTSSWGSVGTLEDTQPGIKSSLDLIKSVGSFTSAVYVLSFTMRTAKFTLVKQASGQIVGKPCTNITYGSYLEFCSRTNGKQDKKGVSRTGYDSENFFEFYTDSNHVYSFETVRTIEDKMRQTYAYLGSGRLKVGWMAFNVSKNLDNGTCEGQQMRLRKVRTVLDSIHRQPAVRRKYINSQQ